MSLSASHWPSQEFLKPEVALGPTVKVIVPSSTSGICRELTISTLEAIEGQPQSREAAYTQQVQITNPAVEVTDRLTDRLCTCLVDAGGIAVADPAPAVPAPQQDGLKSAALQQDSAVSGFTALLNDCSPSAVQCMEQQQAAAPQQLQGNGVQPASSGVTDGGSNSPKSGSVNPPSSFPTDNQNTIGLLQEAGNGFPNGFSLQREAELAQHQQQAAAQDRADGHRADVDGKQSGSPDLPIAKFDPSLVAAVKCASEILQTDDGWSKEEAAATIAALAAKFQTTKSRSAAAAAAAASGSLIPQNSHSSGGRTGGLSSLLPRQDLLAAAAWQQPRLHPFLPSLGKPAAVRAAVCSSAGKQVDAWSNGVGTSPGQTGPGLATANGPMRSSSIPGWGAADAAGDAAAVVNDAADEPATSAGRATSKPPIATNVSSPSGYLGLQHLQGQETAAGNTASYRAVACSSSTGQPDAAQGKPGDAAASAEGNATSAAAAVAMSGFVRKPSVASSGYYSAVDSPNHIKDAADAQQQQQHPAVAIPAAAIAAAASILEGEAKSGQPQKASEQLPATSAAAHVPAAELKFLENDTITSSVANVLNQSGGFQAAGGQPQLPIALLALLHSGQPQALPLMSALLKSGNLRPPVAEALKSRLAAYLQQQQDAGQSAADLVAAAGVAMEEGDVAVTSMQKPDQQLQQQQQEHVQQQLLQQMQAGAGLQQHHLQADQAVQQTLQHQQQLQMQQQVADVQMLLEQQQRQEHSPHHTFHQEQHHQASIANMSAPAESESRSLDSIAAATSHASADASAGRRKRSRQPSVKAAAAFADDEDYVPKPQARGAGKSQPAAAAAGLYAVAPKGKRGRPSKASKAAAAAAAAAACDSSTGADGVHAGAFVQDGLEAMCPGAADMQMQGIPGHMSANGTSTLDGWAAEEQQQQQTLQQFLAYNTLGMQDQALHNDILPPQQKRARLQQQQQQLVQQQLLAGGQGDAFAAQQQSQRQMQQIVPSSTETHTGAAQQLLQQLQQLPPAAAQQVARIAQQLPPDLPQPMRQALLRRAVTAVMSKIGLNAGEAAVGVVGRDSFTAAAATGGFPGVQQQEQQQQQQQQHGPKPSPFAGAAAGDGSEMLLGLLVAAQSHPGLRNLSPQEREAFLKRLLQQRNARLLPNSCNAQQQKPQQLDSAAAAAMPASIDSWPSWLQQQQQQSEQQQSTAAVGGSLMGAMPSMQVSTTTAAAAAAASLSMGMDLGWSPDAAARAAAQVSQGPAASAAYVGGSHLEQASSLPVPRDASAPGAASGSGTFAGLQQAVSMPEGLGDSFVAAVMGQAAAGDMMGNMGSAPAPGVYGGGQHWNAGAGGSGNSAAAASSALQRPQYMQTLEYQLQLHGMNKKQLLELMKEVGPLTALNSIGMHHSVLQSQAGTAPIQTGQVTDLAAAAALPASYMLQQQQQQHQQHQRQMLSGLMQPQQQAQQQQQWNQQTQQLTSLASTGMPGAQQQQQPDWLASGFGSAAANSKVSPFDCMDPTGLYGSHSSAYQHIRQQAHGFNALQQGDPDGPLSSNFSLMELLNGNRPTQANAQGGNMAPSFTSQHNAAAAAAMPVSASAAGGRLRMASAAWAARDGSIGSAAPAVGANASAAQDAAAGWVTGAAAAAGFGSSVGGMADAYKSNSAALDPPILELPDVSLGISGSTAAEAAAVTGNVYANSTQVKGQQQLSNTDYPGALFGSHNDAEDLLCPLGLDLHEVDALLAGMDTGMIGDNAFAVGCTSGGTSTAQGMQDVWSHCRSG